MKISKEEKLKKKKQKQYNKEVMQITMIFFGIFVLLAAYLFYFNFFKSEDVINNPYNKRQDTFSEKVIRGKIFASDMEILAYTETDENGDEIRKYPYGDLFSHVIGYNTKGKLGVELNYNFNLLTSNANLFERVFNELKGEKNIGDNVITTLDTQMQKIAFDSLGAFDGAVIAIDPETGKILCMVSKPTFDPNTIDENWENILSVDDQSDKESGILVNRATQGLYTPGSTFKIFTLFEFIKENSDYNEYTFNCTGNIKVEDSTLSCFDGTAHGSQDLLESFANSCNSSFANIGLGLNMQEFRKTAEKLFFNSELPVDFAYNKSSFKLDTNSSVFQIMQTSIGQGETEVSPLHLAIIMSAAANNGVLMRPYVVDYTQNYVGETVKKYSPEKAQTLFTSDEADILNEFLRAVVTTGTAKKLNTETYEAYGKTGTAETGDENNNLWFAGYAENGDKKLAICVVTEGVTNSYNYSTDTAKELFDYYFSY